MVVPHDDIELPPRYASQDALMLLGSMLFEPQCVPDALRIVSVQDIPDAALRAVFAAIANRHKEAKGDGQALAAMVLTEVREHPAVDNARLLLCDIAESVATAAHVKTFATAVRDAALKRRIVDIATTAAKAASNGQAASEVLADLLADVEDLQRSRDRKDAFSRVSLGELRKDHPELRRPVIHGLLREGETANIIAAPKVGKSWLIYLLTLSVVYGCPFLGAFPVERGRVWLIDNELHPETLAYRLKNVAEAMGLSVEDVERDVQVTSLRGNLQSLQSLLLELDGVQPGEFVMIVLDARYRFSTLDGDENSNTDDTKFYNLVDKIAAKTGAAVVMVHHASKGSQDGKAVTDVGAGAGAQSRAADCHIIIRPHEEAGAAVLEAAVRSFAPVDPLPLRWSFPLWYADHDLDPTRLAGRLPKGEQNRLERDESEKLEIVSKMLKAGEPLAMKGIRQATGFGKEKAERLVFSLMAEGTVVATEAIVFHNKCTVYSVVQEGGGTEGGTEGGTPPYPPLENVPGGGRGVAPKGGPTSPPHYPGTPHSEFLQFAEGA